MTPNQLKNSILQLAIQGKLVEQRPEEGTAEELYKQIQTEKTELIKQGKLKKEKPLPPISPDEIPFELPKNWFWTRLGQILIIARGGSPRPIKDFLTESKDGINWIKIGDSDIGGKYINSTKEKIKPEGVKKSRFVHKGDFLLSNSMSFGRPYILNIDGCIHDGWLVLHPLKEIFDKDFLYYLLSSPMIFNQFCSRVAGAVVNNLNSDKAALTLVPLPPLAEQHRIVAKIEELLPMVEKYGEAYNKLEALNKNFPAEIKKSILQYAIQGKLVEQRPEEGTAEELYKHIQAEKAELIKQGKLKKDKNETTIFKRGNSYFEKIGTTEKCIDDELPFEIPNSWRWARLGNISTYGYSKQKQNALNADKNTWCLELEDIEKGGKLLEKKKIAEKKAVGDKTIFYKGDILYSKLRPYLLKILVADDNGICTPEIVPFKAFGNINHNYFVNYLKSPFVDSLVNSQTYGMKMPRAGAETLLNLLVPLPPLVEQQRIVAKIEELFALANTLINKV